MHVEKNSDVQYDLCAVINSCIDEKNSLLKPMQKCTQAMKNDCYY